MDEVFKQGLFKIFSPTLHSINESLYAYYLYIFVAGIQQSHISQYHCTVLAEEWLPACITKPGVLTHKDFPKKNCC